MIEIIETQVGKTNSETVNLEKQSRIRRGAIFVGRIAAATAVVCVTATPFVYHWAERIGQTVDPVRGSLEDVNQTVGEGVPVLGTKIDGLTREVGDLTPDTTTTEPENPN